MIPSMMSCNCHHYNKLNWSHWQNTEGRTTGWDLLNERERNVVLEYDKKYMEKYGQSPQSDETLIYFTGDRVEYSLTWSAHSGRIPTFRKTSAKFVHRQSMKLLTGQDKLGALAWPVTKSVASNLGTTVMPSIDPQRSDFLAGNSMHLANCSIVLLVGLSCFGYKW